MATGAGVRGRRCGRGAVAAAGREETPGRAAYGSPTSKRDIDLEDLLGGMFGGRGRAARGPIAGADQEAELELTVEEAYHGGQRSLTHHRPDGQRTLDVTIPAGSGRRAAHPAAPGRAAGARGGGRAGDLYLVVRIATAPALPGRRVATSTRRCRSHRGRRRWALPSRSTPRAARQR